MLGLLLREDKKKVTIVRGQEGVKGTFLYFFTIHEKIKTYK